MDASTARTVAASLALITALLLARSLSSPSAIDTQSEKRKSIKAKSKGRNTQNAEVPQYVAGLVNVGNTCFMNAVLQALASLPSLRAYLEARKNIGHAQDSVTLALCETIEMLNTIHRRPTVKRLIRMVSTMKAKAAHVLTSQQQDAQELFQILSSQLSEEREKLDQPGASSLLDRIAVSDILNPPPSGTRRLSSSSVMSSSLSLSHIMLPKREGNGSSPLSPSPPSPSSKDHVVGSNGRGEPHAMTASLILDRNEQEKFSRAKSPFMGLLASRVSCVDCGYTAAIRHSTFDNLSLTVPLQYSCGLEDCLDSFIHLDTITDFNCRKCTVMNASKDLERKINQGRRAQAEEQESQMKERSGDALPSTENGEDLEQMKPLLGTIAKTPKSPSDKRKARRRSSTSPTSTKTPTSRITLAEMEKIKERIDQCLANNIEMDLSPLELTPVRSTRTTKHSMIAKPPQALCLHLNRSMFTSSGQMAKNPCKVQFGAKLDFTRFTTSGHLTTVATKSMSRRGSVSGANGSSTSEMGSDIDIGRGATGATSMFSRRRSIGPVSLSSSWTTYANSEVAADVKSNVNGREYVKGEEDDDRVTYELWAVIVHLGSHNSGHFVTYRRIPLSSSPPASTGRSRNRDSNGVEDVDDVDDLVVSNGDDKAPKSSDKWWRISDEDVQIVDWSAVRNVEAYMLFFEKETS